MYYCSIKNIRITEINLAIKEFMNANQCINVGKFFEAHLIVFF